MPSDRRRTRAILAATTGAFIVAGLSACTPAPAPAVTVTVTATPAPAPTVTVTVAPGPAVTQAPGADPLQPNAPAPEVEEGPARDSGPRTGANGPVATDGNGLALTYTVVAEDAFFDIAQRFDLPQQQLLRMNPSIPNFGETLYIGQIINVDWTTTR